MSISSKGLFSGLLLTALLGGVFLSGCEKNGKPKGTEIEKSQQTYHCAMHPQIVKQGPGECPICGMALIPIEENDSSAMNSGNAPVVRISQGTAQNMGLKTETVQEKQLSSEIRLDGRVRAEEGKVYSVTSRLNGYIETLRVQNTGQRVHTGEVLLELYSPEAIPDLERLSKGDKENLPEVRERVKNWNAPTAFITRLEGSGKAIRLFPIASPAQGIVLQKSVLSGQAVSAGQELYRIADLSTVWVTARVYPSDLARLKKGVPASLRFPNLPDKVFNATLFFISPEVDPATRTVEVRFSLKNTANLDLKPELFAEIHVQDVGTSSGLWISSQSVIRTGTRTLAIVSLGDGKYQPREVQLGRETGEWIEILEGLQAGEQVVTSAQFLIDSESNLRSAVAKLGDITHVR